MVDDGAENCIKKRGWDEVHLSRFHDCAGAAVAGVELAYILTAQAHQLADGAGPRRRDQQLHVVVHQHVCVQPAVAGHQGLA